VVSVLAEFDALGYLIGASTPERFKARANKEKEIRERETHGTHNTYECTRRKERGIKTA